MMNDEHTIAWPHGEFSVLRSGAMCAPATFTLPDGRKLQPFAVAPWQDDGSAEFAELPELLKRLRGEWPCVPFGMPVTRDDLPPAWQPETGAEPGLGNFLHGPSANLEWSVTGEGDGAIALELAYPEEHPIEIVRRRISGDPDGARLIFDLEIVARRDCALPIGVHPVFRLPERPGAAHLEIDGNLRVFTYPVQAEPGVSKLAEGQVFDALSSARYTDGSPVDLSRHPLEETTEEILLVAGVQGRAVLSNHDEGYAATLRWDAEAFPSCNLWISNKGRNPRPWNGAFQAIGIEPVAAPFDLGAAVAAHDGNPLHEAGVACRREFTAGESWTTRYSIEVSSL